jgi:hypothetical protein
MKLWKENKLNQEWEKPNEEIANEFIKSKFNNETRPTDSQLRLFVTARDGLNSVFEEDEYQELYELVLKLLKKREE